MSRRDRRTIAVTAVLITAVVVFVIAVSRSAQSGDMEDSLRREFEASNPAATVDVDCEHVNGDRGDCTVTIDGTPTVLDVSTLGDQYVWVAK